MTPEEQVKESGMKMALREAEILNSKLLAALEEAEHQKNTILAGHERDFNELYRIERQLAEAKQTIALKQSSIDILVGQVTDETALHAKTTAKLIIAEQTIARQREALEQIDKECRKRSFNDCGDLRAVVYDIAYAALGGETQP